jgi:uncharacterized membrane protein YjgN (DUF898 family)
MIDLHKQPAGEEPGSAFTFTGTWREFLPIALTNLLLTIVTLGVYRFWAKARERRYLWSRTQFIDDHLEWTGTGTEMFIGFLIVMAVLIPIGLFFQFGFTAMVMRGEESAAILIGLAIYIGIFYLIGVGQFRALRYRLSRTWWHGIRGGSEDGGWHYGWSYLWKTVVGWAAAGMMVPWSMTSLWNERWNQMSFGQIEFRANAEIGNLIVRWLLIYLSPFIGMLLMGVAALIAWGLFGSDMFTNPTEAQAAMGIGFVFLPWLPAGELELLCRLLPPGRQRHTLGRHRVQLQRPYQGLAEARPRQHRAGRLHAGRRADVHRLPQLVVRRAPPGSLRRGPP